MKPVFDKAGDGGFQLIGMGNLHGAEPLLAYWNSKGNSK
jgi:hypothetical protein